MSLSEWKKEPNSEMRMIENKLGLDFGKEGEGFTLNINSGGWQVLQSKVTKPLHPRLTYAKMSHEDHGVIEITYLSSTKTVTGESDE